MGPFKRKRSERERMWDGSRPSPHRPDEFNMAQHGQYGQHDRGAYGGGGYGRGRGGGGFGRGAQRNDRRDQFPQNQSQNYGLNQIRPGPSSSFPQQISPARPSAAMPSPSSVLSTLTATASAPASEPTAPTAPSLTLQSQPQSQAQSQTIPTPASAPAPAPAAPIEPLVSFYHYDLVTDEHVANWSRGSRLAVIQSGKQAREDMDVSELSGLVQDFVRSVIAGRLDPVDAGQCLKEILGPETNDAIEDAYSFEPHSLFLDTLAIMMDNEPALIRAPLRDFLVATGVSTTLMRQILDAPLLLHLGLIRDSFVKLGIRQTTNILYRQANYNLLREESEGYSKLITELFSTSSSEPPTATAAIRCFERTQCLIGTFDLDVGRVLDVTLDVFAAVLIKQFRFYVKFLRVSSWWPRSNSSHDSQFYAGGLPPWGLPTSESFTTSEEDEAQIAQRRLARDVRFWDRAREAHLDAFFELGGYEIADGTNFETEPANEHDVRQRWIAATNTNPPTGNRTAAQLLGFKLRFYNSDARDAADVLPANLLYLAALLIKIGFISLCDLHEHLWPNDDKDMEALRDKKMKELREKEKASRPGGGMNALMMAGALSDDVPSSIPARRDQAKPGDAKATASSASTAADPKSTELPEPMEQKVSLLVCLLTIGAIPESLFLLGRHPWVLEAFPDTLDRLHRILHHSLDKVYRETIPTSSTAQPASILNKLIAEVDQTGVSRGGVNMGRTPTKKFLRWPFPDKFDHTDCQNYRFYWDEWADNVPVCQTVDDVFTLCGSLLNLSGVCIGKDEGLLSKLCRIGEKSLEDDRSEANMARWQDLLRRLLVPALSHTKPNAAIVCSVWSLLRLYPTAVRFGIYAEWYEGQVSRFPAMVSAFAKSRLETLSTMKRLSLTNLREMAKSLAKTSLCSPGIVFKVALDQIESYANLIDAFVECARYFTDLAYDVLVWSLLSSLGRSRSRKQESSILLTSKWLQALAKFSGQVFRRYADMSPMPVLRYVDHQLLAGNSTDLIILKELISSMGGIVQTIDFTDAQIMAMSGGPILQRQTLVAGQDRRFESGETAKRLIDALLQSGLAKRLLINIAQYRDSAIYRVPEDEAHIKYLSSVVDDSHQILIQFLDFLRSHLEPGTFERTVPSITSLINEFGVSVSIAFLIGRDTLADRMFPAHKDETEKQPPSAAAAAAAATAAVAVAVADKDDEGDVAMGDAAAVDVAVSKDDEKVATTTTMTTAAKGRRNDAMLDTLQPIIDSMQATKGQELWTRLSPEFYVMFWTLQLGDLAVPMAQYSDERNRIIKEVEAINRDRSDMTRAGVDRKNQAKSKLLGVAQSLLAEQSEHEVRHLKKRFQISRRAKSWFPHDFATDTSLADAFLVECLLPRIVISAADAEYCHRMVRSLHDWNTPNFRLLKLYERLFSANRIRALIFDSTVREAEHLGRYLKLVLADLAAWHKDKALYEKEGGSRKTKERSGDVEAGGKSQTFVDHDQFRDLLWGWHRNLNTALRGALGGMEWMHIRNAITVLKYVLDSFPAVDFMATKFVAQLKAITERESGSKANDENDGEGHRVDLAVAAQTALSELQKRKSKWVKLVTDFRPNLDGEKSAEPKSAKAPPTLRATAPAFKPQAAASPDPGAKPLPRTTSIAVSEDGEIKDRPHMALDNRTNTSARPPSAAPTAKETIPPKPPVPAAREGDTYRSQTPSAPVNTSQSTLGAPPVGLPSKPTAASRGAYAPQDRNGPPPRRDVRDQRDPRDGPAGSRDMARDPRAGRDMRDGRDSRDPRDSNWDLSTGRRHQVDPSPTMQGRGAPPQTDLPLRRSDPPNHDREPRPPNHNLPPSRPRPEPVRSGSGPAPARQTRDSMMPAPQQPILSPAQRRQQFLQQQEEKAQEFRQQQQQQPSQQPAPTSSAAKEPAIDPERAALLQAKDDGPSRGSRNDAHERDETASFYRQDGWSSRDARDRPYDGGARDDQDTRRNRYSGPTGGGLFRQDANYGRLDPAMADVPSGPRGRGRGIKPSKPDDGRLTNDRFRGPDGSRTANDGFRGASEGARGAAGGSYRPSEHARGASPDRAPPPTGLSAQHDRTRSDLPSPKSTPMSELTPLEQRNLNKNKWATANKPNMNAPPTGLSTNAPQSQTGESGGVGTGSSPSDAPRGPHGQQSQQYGYHPTQTQSSSSMAGRAPSGPASHQSLHDPSIDVAPSGPAHNGRAKLGSQPPRMINDINHALRSNAKRSQQPVRHLAGTDVKILAGGSPVTPQTGRFEQASVDRGYSASFGDGQGRGGRERDNNNNNSNNNNDRDSWESRRGTRGVRRNGQDQEWNAGRAHEQSPGRDRDLTISRDRRDWDRDQTNNNTTANATPNSGETRDGGERDTKKYHDRERDRDRDRGELVRRSTRDSLGAGRDTPGSSSETWERGPRERLPPSHEFRGRGPRFAEGQGGFESSSATSKNNNDNNNASTNDGWAGQQRDARDGRHGRDNRENRDRNRDREQERDTRDARDRDRDREGRRPRKRLSEDDTLSDRDTKRSRR